MFNREIYETEVMAAEDRLTELMKEAEGNRPTWETTLLRVATGLLHGVRCRCYLLDNLSTVMQLAFAVAIAERAKCLGDEREIHDDEG